MVRSMSISVLVAFSAVFLYCGSAVTGQEIVFADSRPVSTSSSECNCVLLRQCLSLFRPGQRMTYREAIEIRRRRCGFEGVNMKVCCPSSGPTPVDPIRATTWPTTLPSTPQCGQSSKLNRVHGGENASLGAHPWMVAMLYREPALVRNSDLTVKCGGSLITSQHVLTAAHCVHPDELGSMTLEQLNVGDWNIATDPDCESDAFVTECVPDVPKRKPAKITWHPQYNSNRRFNNDIAIIRLDQPIDIPSYSGYINTVCVPSSFSESDYTKPYATGWGETERSGGSDILQQIRLPFVDFQRCNSSFRNLLSENQMCAGGEAGKDTCFGDSGGPLVALGANGPPVQVIGLTSFGKGFCGGEGNFGVYTVVASFRQWIEQTLRL